MSLKSTLGLDGFDLAIQGALTALIMGGFIGFGGGDDGAIGATMTLGISLVVLWIRRAIAAIYDAELRHVGKPAAVAGTTHVYHQYVIRHRHRDGLRQRMKAMGVATNVHYPMPVHLQPAYAGRVALGPRACKATEALATTNATAVTRATVALCSMAHDDGPPAGAGHQGEAHPPGDPDRRPLEPRGAALHRVAPGRGSEAAGRRPGQPTLPL